LQRTSQQWIRGLYCMTQLLTAELALAREILPANNAATSGSTLAEVVTPGVGLLIGAAEGILQSRLKDHDRYHFSFPIIDSFSNNHQL
jgi:hypothetical protein